MQKVSLSVIYLIFLMFYSFSIKTNRSFTKATRVFLHVYENHVFINCTAKTATNNDELSCEWGGPHGMGPGCQSKRPRLSLLTHLQVSLSCISFNEK